jgi:hypothetical protein
MCCRQGESPHRQQIAFFEPVTFTSVTGLSPLICFLKFRQGFSLNFLVSLLRVNRTADIKRQSCMIHAILYGSEQTVLLGIYPTFFLCNKTNQMHKFYKSILSWNSTCFGQTNCPKPVEFHDKINVKFVHLGGFITKKSVTMHGHMNVK